MRISKRLSVLLEMVPNSTKILADIGADHGYLTMMALNNKKAEYVYATDISKRSLEKTKLLIEKKGLKDKCSCIVADGLDSFGEKTNIDCAVIAGMGGNEIVKILLKSEFLTNIKHFLLQPVQDAYVLRKFLSENNFNIIEDRLVFEKGKYYACLLCQFGTEKHLNDIQCYLGQNCENDQSVDFVAYLRYTYDTMKLREKYLTPWQQEVMRYCKIRLNEKI